MYVTFANVGRLLQTVFIKSVLIILLTKKVCIPASNLIIISDIDELFLNGCNILFKLKGYWEISRGLLGEEE